MHTIANSSALVQLYDLPSARTKIRKIKKAKDKQLLKLSRKQRELWNSICTLGYEELAPPIQRGWKRSFILRSDIAESKHAAFYQEILDSINTVCHSQRKDFKVKKRRRGRYGYVVQAQELKAPSEHELKKMKLSDEQRALFRKTEYYCHCRKQYLAKYVFSEPWRFVLKVQPNIITKVRIKDWQLERELKLISNHIEARNLEPLIEKLRHGATYKWWKWYNNPNRYFNPLKGKSLAQVAYEYKQELEETNGH